MCVYSLRYPAWYTRAPYCQLCLSVGEWKTNLMSLAILFHFLCGARVAGWSRLQPATRAPLKTSHTKISNTQRTENKKTGVVIHQHSRKLLMMDILMSETCWAHKKWNKIASDIKLVFHSSSITMMHGPINIRCACLIQAYFSTLSHQHHYFPPQKELLNPKRVFWFSLQLLSAKFLIRWRTARDTIKDVCCSSCTAPVIPVRYQWILKFLNRFSKNSQTSNFLTIGPGWTQLLNADGWLKGRRTDRHDETNQPTKQLTNSKGQISSWKVSICSAILGPPHTLRYLKVHYRTQYPATWPYS